MSNPNNAVGTNGAFGGRTSVNAFNDILSIFSGRGIVSGWACSPKSGLTVALGGSAGVRDVAVAVDAAGNKTTVNNISQSPIQVTVNAAPASNSRVDAIVAYIEDSPNGSGETDNPDVVNLLVVSGTVASTPSRPTDNTIRTAITADGASGATAYYVVLAYVTVPTGTTDIDATMISAGDAVSLVNGAVKTNSIADAAVTAEKIADGAVGMGQINFSGVQTSTVQSLGFGLSCPLIRFGNMVIASGSGVTTQAVPSGYLQLDEAIPTGYRPTTTVGILGNSITGSGSNIGSTIGWVVKPDGTMETESEGITVFPTRVNFCGAWVTADEWPSS